MALFRLQIPERCRHLVSKTDVQRQVCTGCFESFNRFCFSLIRNETLFFGQQFQQRGGRKVTFVNPKLDLSFHSLPFPLHRSNVMSWKILRASHIPRRRSKKRARLRLDGWVKKWSIGLVNFVHDVQGKNSVLKQPIWAEWLVGRVLLPEQTGSNQTTEFQHKILLLRMTEYPKCMSTAGL